MELLNIIKEEDDIKEDEDNIENNTALLNRQYPKLPKFCSRLRDYQSYNY